MNTISNTNKLSKWHKLSPYQEKHNSGPKCLLCPNGCMIKENEKGICKTRVNYKGDIYSIAYGNPCTINIDPIEKKPLFHFLPGGRVYSIATAGCNFSCLNCQNWQISQTSPLETDNYELTPEDAVKQAIKYNTKMIAYTYTEPVVFAEYVYNTARLAKQKGLKNIFISNGYIN